MTWMKMVCTPAGPLMFQAVLHFISGTIAGGMIVFVIYFKSPRRDK